MSDLIDRDALKADIDALEWFTTDHVQPEDVFKAIDNAPTVEAEPVEHGEWILMSDEMSRIYTTCANCRTNVCFTNYRHGMKIDMRGANYCPNCGAKMDKEEQDG